MKLDVKDMKVAFAIPSTSGQVPLDTMMALCNAIVELDRLGVTYEFLNEKHNSLIQFARESLALSFLETDCTHIFWLDDDVIPEPNHIVRLIYLASHYPMVGAAYVTKNFENPKFIVKNVEVAELGLYKADGMGMGFVCMQREVIETVSKDESDDMFRVYKERLEDGTKNPVGEDMHFFRMAKKHGYTLYVDPVPMLGHKGSFVYKASLFETLRRAKINS